MSNLTKLLMLLAIGLLLAVGSIYFVGGKKLEYDIVANVKARPDQLFPYLTDSELKKKWSNRLVSQTFVADEEWSENTELRTVLQIGDEQLEFRGTVIRFQENEILSIKSKHSKLDWTTFYRLEPKGNDTRLEYRRIIKFNGFDRIWSVFADDQNQQEIEQEIAKLVKLVESEVDNSATSFVSDETADQADQSSNGDSDGDTLNDAD